MTFGTAVCCGCFADPPPGETTGDGTGGSGDASSEVGTSVTTTEPSSSTSQSESDTHASSGDASASTDSGSETSEGSRPPVVEPAALAIDPGGNGVLDLEEDAAVAPAWTATTEQGGEVVGTAVDFSGPGPARSSIVDDTARYTFAGGDTVSCADAAPGDCYTVRISAKERPQTHWDTELGEELDSGAAHVWTIHVGESFADVLPTSRYYAAIETALHHGLTTGCTDATYCPATEMTRAQAAVFVASAMLGPGEAVPHSGDIPGLGAYDCSAGGSSLFEDVAPSSLFCPHIHYLVANDVTSGCTADPPAFCPNVTITRASLAVFVAEAVADEPVPADYADPDTGLAYDCGEVGPDVHFDDVGTGHFACAHVHYLWARGAAVHCTAPTTFCPGDEATRAQTAQFVVDGFAFALYGP